jgi:hypothetical protein
MQTPGSWALHLEPSFLQPSAIVVRAQPKGRYQPGSFIQHV